MTTTYDPKHPNYVDEADVRDELTRVLVEPKNALTRQYEKLFGLEQVKLHFPDETIETVADRALELDPGHAWALLQRGSAHSSLRNFSAAIADYERVYAVGWKAPEPEAAAHGTVAARVLADLAALDAQRILGFDGLHLG